MVFTNIMIIIIFLKYRIYSGWGDEMSKHTTAYFIDAEPAARYTFF